MKSILEFLELGPWLWFEVGDFLHMLLVFVAERHLEHHAVQIVGNLCAFRLLHDLGWGDLLTDLVSVSIS